MNTEMAKEMSGNVGSRESTRGGHHYRPNVDIVELKDELLLKVDMPGSSADKVTLNYEKGILTLHGAVKTRQPEDMKFLIREYGVADFHREFLVAEEIDVEKITAEYKHGVLTVHLPKAETVKPRRIEVAGK